MIGFWILAALLLLAGYVFFVPALRGKPRQTAIDRQRLNLMLHHQRREELSRESGKDDLEGLTAELDRDLLGDLAAVEPRRSPMAGGSGRTPLILALVLAPIVAFVLYTQFGRPDLADFKAMPQAHNDEGTTGLDIQAMIDRLAERLQKNPNDLQGWMLLGRSYHETEQFDRALEAYEHAMQLAPENLDVLGFYAESMAAANGGSFKGRPVEIAADILKKDPQHRNGLWLAGAAAAESGDMPQAIAHLTLLKAQFPADGADAKLLAGIIAKLQGRQTMNAEAPAPTPGQVPAGGSEKAIRVKVSLAGSLASKAAPGDTVFIFARAASGPPMPLAIVRKQVKDLPVEVTLDDSMSMVQGMNLSAFDKLIIGARVSKTGNALPSPGDLQGMTEPTLAENGKAYAVEIGQLVRRGRQ